MELWVGSMIGGVIGAVMGHGANHFIGWFKENKQSSPERKFICAELVFLLENYAVKCAEVVQDDGEPNGDQGEYDTTTKIPDKIDYSLVKGNWKSLKSKTMYENHRPIFFKNRSAHHSQKQKINIIRNKSTQQSIKHSS